MILIVSVFLIIYVLTLEKSPLPVSKKDNKKPSTPTITNPFKSSLQDMPPNATIKVDFTQKCQNGMNMPPGSKCYDEDFTQENECPTLTDMLNKRVNQQQVNFKKSRDIGLPFPKGEGPSAQVNDYIGTKDDDWFNDSQYQTIQKIVEDPSRQMRATQGNVIPGGGDTRAWPETLPIDRTEAALMLQPLPTQGNNIQTNQLSS